MIELVLSIVVPLFVYFIWAYKCRKNNFRFFKDRGIDGPEPNFVYGNLQKLAKDSLNQIKAWNKKYGKNRNFGIFLGTKPFLVSTDLELASKVLIKDFFNFINRGELSPFDSIHPITKNMLIFTRLYQWKSVRNYLTPSFSTAKLKASVPMIEKGCQDLLSYCDEMCSKDEAFDMYSAWKCLTTDNISRVAFGMESNTVKDPNNINPVIQGCYNAIETSITTWKHQLIQSFPILFDGLSYAIDVLYKFGCIHHPFDDTIQYLNNLVECRRKEGKHSNDFISSLLKAEAYTTTNYADFTIRDDTERNEVVPAKSTNGTRMPDMSVEAVAANSLLFFLAGFETTSTALAFITNRLAENQDVQDRLRQEIVDGIQENGGTITYESATRIPYLGQVINESLRMNPPVTFFTTRQALNDFEFKGKIYPKGISIMFPTPVIQNDPEYFPDPEKFDPDRFNPERKSEIPSMAFQPFGDGPRNCIGMRVALTQIKLVLCHLLSHYRILPGKELEIPRSRGLVLSCPTSVSIRLEKLAVV